MLKSRFRGYKIYVWVIKLYMARAYKVYRSWDTAMDSETTIFLSCDQTYLSSAETRLCEFVQMIPLYFVILPQKEEKNRNVPYIGYFWKWLLSHKSLFTGCYGQGESGLSLTFRHPWIIPILGNIRHTLWRLHIYDQFLSHHPVCIWTPRFHHIALSVFRVAFPSFSYFKLNWISVLPLKNSSCVTLHL